MKAALTRLTTLLLLAMLAMPWVLTSLQQYQQQRLHHEMREKLEKAMLQSITIHEKDVKWTRLKKEISINGRMFDIKSIHYHDHQYTFTGLFDEEETILVKNIRDQQQKENNNGTRLLGKLFHFIGTITEPSQNNIDDCYLSAGKPGFYFASLSSVYSPVITPPPQTALFL